ncbi:hypothetical protein E2C01_002192 [Portunus trituberculatus]|uniref:Uncharacterized protein n=1 Tax=Portunus trituberculatus TaxID=210409 RepID=A0A5B7CJ32_PORTR|nr:hypothetical protein [Portunus trituberculatus]
MQQPYTNIQVLPWPCSGQFSQNSGEIKRQNTDLNTRPLPGRWLQTLRPKEADRPTNRCVNLFMNHFCAGP